MPHRRALAWEHTHSRKTSETGEESGLPTVEFKAFDLDTKVKDDHRKLADMKNRKHLDCSCLYLGSNQNMMLESYDDLMFVLKKVLTKFGNVLLRLSLQMSLIGY